MNSYKNCTKCCGYKYYMHSKFLFLFFCFSVFSSSLLAEEEKNRIIVCENSLEMFQWDLDFLKEAQHSVEVLACFFGGETAQKLLKALELRLSEVPHLQVYILASPILLDPEDGLLIEVLRQKYPHNFHIEFSTQVARLFPDIVGADNHIKFYVVDGTYFSAGGTNLEERHCTDGTFKPVRPDKEVSEIKSVLPSAMRDQDIVGRGSIARQLRHIFFQLYSLWERYNQTHILEVNPENFRHNRHFFTISTTPYVERFETSERVRELIL